MIDRNKNIGFWFPRPERGLALARELTKKGYEITIYHNKPIKNKEVKSIRVKYHFITGILQLLRSNHDIYYTSSSFSPVLQLLILKILKNKPYIYVINSPLWRYFSENNKSLKFFYTFFLYPFLLRISIYFSFYTVSNSKYVRNLIIDRYPSQKSKIKCVYNGIDFKRFENIKLSKFKNDSPVFLCISTINFRQKTNGVVFVINCFIKLAQMFPKSKLILSLKCSNNEHFNFLKKKIKNSGAEKKIIIYKNYKNLENLYKRSNIFLFATPEESTDSLPRVLIEAQSTGIPTIATKTVGCPEVLFNLNQQPFYSEKDFLKIMILTVKNYSDFKEMGLINRDKFFKKFGWATMAKNYIKLFN